MRSPIDHVSELHVTMVFYEKIIFDETRASSFLRYMMNIQIKKRIAFMNKNDVNLCTLSMIFT